MALIKSISGIRGTIGGTVGEAFTPIDIVKFSAAFGSWLMQKTNNRNIIVGRDARLSGLMVNNLVISTLQALGMNVIDTGLSTTPTVEMAVANESVAGGIIITASHNPKQWNALKLLNAKGEFINDQDGKEVLDIAQKENFKFAQIDDLGTVSFKNYFEFHIDKIIELQYVNLQAIKKRKFKVAIDCINSTGGIVLPMLLNRLGVFDIVEINCDPTGDFAHNPEPLPQNLSQIAAAVVAEGCDLGIVVDPDVDRLCFVNEDGTFFGEEYTLVAIADYVLGINGGGNTVSNLSSTRSLRDVTQKHGGIYTASAVGEVNVVEAMRATNALIGGEGNGGIILPELHYGRDALVGVALFLSQLALAQTSISALRAAFPNPFMSKEKIDLNPDSDLKRILEQMYERYADQRCNRVDGLRIDFEDSWVHLRGSNTEPIIRIYAEAPTEKEAKALTQKIVDEINTF